MNIWIGRMDGEDKKYHRVFQRVVLETNYLNIAAGDFVLHGFAVDEGVRRNLGRLGARTAPDIIRKNMASFPVFRDEFVLKDFQNITCTEHNLELAQEALASCIAKTGSQGAKSVVVGGGHEVMWGHYSGIKKAFPNKKIGIITIDAHFDNREPNTKTGVSSGTGFWQLAQEREYHTLHIGIQKNSNTRKLFEFAAYSDMPFILADDLYFANLPYIFQQIDTLSNRVDILYLTICMDVFNAAIAPGVSAMAYNGIFADAAFLQVHRHIINNNKLVALDIAEVNPLYDINERTARLAAALVNEWFMVS